MCKANHAAERRYAQCEITVNNRSQISAQCPAPHSEPESGDTEEEEDVAGRWSSRTDMQQLH